METEDDPDTVQAHLQRFETLVALHKEVEVRYLLVRLHVPLFIFCKMT